MSYHLAEASATGNRDKHHLQTRVSIAEVESQHEACMEEAESQLETRTSSHLKASTSSRSPPKTTPATDVMRAAHSRVDTEIEIERLGAVAISSFEGNTR
jgi:hypothetical protein